MCFFGFSFTPLSLSLGYFSYLPHVHHDLVPISLPSPSRLECHMIMALFKFAETFIPPCYPPIVIPSGYFCYSTLSLARRRSTSPSHLMSSLPSLCLSRARQGSSSVSISSLVVGHLYWTPITSLNVDC